MLVDGPPARPGTASVDVPLPPRPPVAWRPVLLVACALAVVLGVTSAWYGAFGDELYFLSAGRRAAWGYADQPPLVPVLAAALDALAPGNLVVLRLPSTLASGANVVVGALIAAELGGRRRAQLMAAVATAISPYLLETGHLLATSTVDPLMWALLLWLLVRWVRAEHEGRPADRLLLAGGAVLALALAVKVLVVVLLAALLVGVLVAGPRRMLTRPSLWAGVVLAVLTMLPTLAWQAAHGWPQLQMGSVVAGESGLFGNRWLFLPWALYYAGLLPGVVLVLLGGWVLLRWPSLAPWRFLGVAAVVATLALLAAGGRPYYVAGLYAALYAAGAVAFQHVTDAGPADRRWRWALSVPAFALSAVVVLVAVLPLGPSSWRVRHEFVAMGQVGWTSLADDVAARYRDLPPEQRAHTAVLGWSYWYAAALDTYGPERGLPPAHSGHRGFWYFGPPPDSDTAAIVVGKARPDGFCRRLVPLAPHVDPSANAGMNGEVPLSLCTPAAPWSVMWPSMRVMQ